MSRGLIYGIGGVTLLACGDESKPQDSGTAPTEGVTELTEAVADLQAQLTAMEAEVNELQNQVIELEESETEPVDPYTDADALAALASIATAIGLLCVGLQHEGDLRRILEAK